MPYITREDGERFVIPSYRDTLSAKKSALLKKELMLLSSNYGEYITLQRKNADQYEAAFSPDSGYLLGETVWHYFKRPIDLIYCEAIPNTSDAILVIVKGGSVYLDGSFPVDSIPEELVVFRTQQNHFDIYIHGDVPISQAPEVGKFALDSSSINSFNILAEPVFPSLPTVKAFQLRLVSVVLKAHGIGVIPVRNLIVALGVVFAIWMIIVFLTTHKKEIPVSFVGTFNPYQSYIDELSSPDPANELMALKKKVEMLYTIPGWHPEILNYNGGMLAALMKSNGVKTNVLFSWAGQHGGNVQILQDGIYLSLGVPVPSRQEPTTITASQQVMGEIIDRLSSVVPTNTMKVESTINKGRFSEMGVTLSITDMSLDTLTLLAQQFEGLPVVLSKVTFTVKEGTLTGTIMFKVLGN